MTNYEYPDHLPPVLARVAHDAARYAGLDEREIIEYLANREIEDMLLDVREIAEDPEIQQEFFSTKRGRNLARIANTQGLFTTISHGLDGRDLANPDFN